MATNPTWKKLERWAGTMLGGARHWANSGEAVDAEGPLFTAQCKLVRELSLGNLTALAAQAEAEGRARGKIGVVVAKQSGRRGGKRTPAIFVLHEDAWRDLHGRIATTEE